MDTQKEEGNATQNENDTSTKPDLIVEIATISTKEKPNTENPTNNTTANRIDLVMVFTGIIALCNIILIGFTFVQVAISRKSADDFREITQTEARAYIIERAAPEAIGENKLTFTNNKDSSYTIEIGLRIENIGKTPAYISETAYNISIDSMPYTNAHMFTDQEKFGNREFMAANEDWGVHPVLFNIPYKDIMLILAKKERITLSGYINYTDIFHQYHFVHYCYDVSPFGFINKRGQYNEAN